MQHVETEGNIEIAYDADNYQPFTVRLVWGTVRHSLPPMDLWELTSLATAIARLKEKVEQ